MKKHSFILIFILSSMLLFVACQNNPPNQTVEEDWKSTNYETIEPLDNLTVFVNEGSVSKTGLSITFENKSESQYLYSEDFIIEKKIDGNWYVVPVIIKEPYGFDEIAFIIKPHGKSEWSVDWEWLYGKLDSGEYRMIKRVYGNNNEGESMENPVVVEFIID